MANSLPIFDWSFISSGNLSSNQYYFVTLSTAAEVAVASAVTDVPIGVLQNNPDSSGKVALVRVIGGTKVSADAALEIGNFIGPSADGQAVSKTIGTSANDGEYICGRVISATSAAGEHATAFINCVAPWYNVIGASS